jgi:integrase
VEQIQRKGGKTKVKGGRVFQRGETFWIAYYLRGQEFRESARTDDPDKAKRFLRQRIRQTGADMIGAKKFIPPQTERLLVNDLLNSLERDLKLRGKYRSQARLSCTLQPLRDKLGTLPALSVDADTISEFIERQLDAAYTRSTVNRSTQLLGQAFKLAIRQKRINDMPYIQRLSEKGNERQGFFVEPEIRRVIANLPADLADFVLFAWLTGMRKGEIASLRWADVDGKRILLRAENAKTGESRSIPIVGEIAELIERRKPTRAVKLKNETRISELIFHRKGEPILEFRKTWTKATSAAKVPGKLFHDLRRSAVRDMIDAGVPQVDAMAISGHKTDSMFRRYKITSDTNKIAALERTSLYRQTVKENVQEIAR